METLADNVRKLSEYVARMEVMRYSTPLANDIFEAAWYWRDLGKWVLEKNTKVNYPARVAEERLLLERLKVITTAHSADEQRLYEPVFATANAVLDAVAQVAPEEDGHLGILRIIRVNFRFLQTDYGFAVADQQPTGMRFSSSSVWIKLQYAQRTSQCCTFGREGERGDKFWPEDLLFMYGDDRYREVQQERLLQSDKDLTDWFQFLAEIWRSYGQDVFTNQPGIFDRLKQAQIKRDAEFVSAMNKKYGAGSDLLP